uniref:Uncharacterized protein n=1 Tax=Plectus sambesii TaxID=2011161 RepID=A0A914UGS1_9BILA
MIEKHLSFVRCTTEENPKNLTVPVIPLGVGLPPPPPASNASGDEEDKEVVPPTAGPSSPGPPQLAQYLLCVDQCALAPTAPKRFRRSPLNCSIKMKCALAPPTEEVQEAFRTCEEELKVDARQRFIASCECMKAAGVTDLDCNPPAFY